MLKELLMPEILQLIRERQWTDMREALVIWPPVEVADLLSSIDQPARVLLLRFLPRVYQAEVFAELTPKLQNKLLADLANHEVSALLADLSPDDRAALIDEMPAEVTKRLFSLLSPQDLDKTRQLLGYPEGCVGRVMTPNFVAISADMTVGDALEHIRTHGEKSETIDVVYVTDNEGKLIDEVSLRHLILAQTSKKVSEVMDGKVVFLSGMSQCEEAMMMIKKYNYIALPVVDSSGVLLGIVTVDDLLDVAETELTEDFHKLGAVGIEPGGDGPIESISEAKISTLFRRRIGWLVLLVLVNILSGFGLSLFENTIAAIVTLVLFLPMLVGSGGNAGSQSATLVVRALAMGDVAERDAYSMLFKELKVSFLLGLTMAAVAFGISMFRGWPQHINPLVASTVVGMSMVLIVMFGSLVGMFFPFVLQKFGKDPAIASVPLVTSIADICGVMIYFAIASTVLI